MRKKWWHYPIRMIDSMLDRVAAVLGVFIFVQFPQFFSQYIQRLGGHLDEARRIVDLYIKAANSLNLTFEEYINIHLAANNPVFVSSGEQISQIAERFYALEKSLFKLLEATPLTRLWTFLREADWEIAAQTWRFFTPGIPTTMEGLVYAIIGLFLGWGIYSGIRALYYLIKDYFTTKTKRRKYAIRG